MGRRGIGRGTDERGTKAGNGGGGRGGRGGGWVGGKGGGQKGRRGRGVSSGAKLTQSLLSVYRMSAVNFANATCGNLVVASLLLRCDSTCSISIVGLPAMYGYAKVDLVN
jgi:hypothetical protein